MPQPDSNEELANRASAGDADALSILLERHGPSVRARLSIPEKWRSVLSEDDVMQQTYIEAFLHVEDFSPLGEDSFRAWLSTIATNVLRDALDWLGAVKRGGDRSRLGGAGLEESAAALIDMLNVEGGTPSRDAAMSEWVARLLAAVEKLPPRRRDVVKLLDLQQRPAETVAHELGCTLGAMYMLRRRAHLQLRETLGSTSSASSLIGA